MVRLKYQITVDNIIPVYHYSGSAIALRYNIWQNYAKVSKIFESISRFHKRRNILWHILRRFLNLVTHLKTVSYHENSNSLMKEILMGTLNIEDGKFRPASNRWSTATSWLTTSRVSYATNRSNRWIFLSRLEYFLTRIFFQF